MYDLAVDSRETKYGKYLQKYKQIYHVRSSEERRALAHIKRFLERYTGDEDFRSGILSGIVDIEKGAEAAGCDLTAVDFKTLYPIFHSDYFDQRKPELLPKWPAALLWDTYIQEMLALRADMLLAGDSDGYNRAFDLWRVRQINRASFDLGLGGLGIVHPPVCFEVSSGCSVGCWFCGISAEKFRGHFDLANGGADEWRTVLAQVKSVVGDALNSGFLYWATEPLDNPQYVDILDIFYESTNVYPQTTSAIPLRDIELTRGVISRWETGGGYPNRFSILNTKTLIGVHETFTPEELFNVELVLQNKGNASNTKTNAGKAKSAVPIQGPNPINSKAASTSKSVSLRGGNAPKKGFNMASGTIACVSGFLINIVEKSVRLISPCMPSSDIPDGYIVFATSHYEKAADLGDVMRKMITDFMPVDLDAGRLIKFSHNVSYSSTDGKGTISGSATKMDSPMIDLFASYLDAGPASPRDLLKSAIADGKNPFKVVNAIEKARRAGLVDSVGESPN